MELLKDFRDNDSLRASFNALAKETFGLNFEDWYQNGYWTDRYNPHSVVVDGQVVSNVSVNQTYFEVEGKVLRFLQLGRFKAHLSIKVISKIISKKIDAIHLIFI